MATGSIVRASTGNNIAQIALATGAPDDTGVVAVARHATPVDGRFSVSIGGIALVLLETGLTPLVGETVFLSATVAGRGTNVAPTMQMMVGTIISTALYAARSLVTIIMGTSSGVTDGGVLFDKTFFADQLDLPNNADWAVGVPAPTETKGGTDDDIKIAAFSDSVLNARSFPLIVPDAGADIELQYEIAAAAAPTAPDDQAEMQIQTKRYNDGAAPGAWSAVVSLGEQSIAANTFLNKFTISGTLADFNLVAGGSYNILIRRNIAVTDELPGDLDFWYIRPIIT